MLFTQFTNQHKSSLKRKSVYFVVENLGAFSLIKFPLSMTMSLEKKENLPQLKLGAQCSGNVLSAAFKVTIEII